jgi:hypothetical protein
MGSLLSFCHKPPDEPFELRDQRFGLKKLKMMTSSHSYQVDKSKRRFLLTSQVQSTQFATLAYNEAEVANIFDKWDGNISESEDEDGTCEEDDESELEEEDEEEESEADNKNEVCHDE